MQEKKGNINQGDYFVSNGNKSTQESKQNKTGISLSFQMKEDNKFGPLVFCDTDFKLKILKFYNPNCVPFEYGGYHMLEEYNGDDKSKDKKELNDLDSLYFYDELAEYLLSNILIKEIF